MGRKIREIQTAIREVMQNNVIDLALMGTKQNAADFRQSGRLFLYVEIKNTRPAICHVYDMELPLRIGRSEAENQICIQEPEVSREHAVIWRQDGCLYAANVSGTGLTGVRRRLRTRWLGPGESERLFSKDVLLVGRMKIKLRIFRGENEII